MDIEKALLELADNTNEPEIDFRDLFYFLFRRVKYIIIALLIGVVCAFIYAFFLVTPMYEATSQLYVVNSKDSALDLSDLQIGTYLTSDYELVFQTWEVNQQVKNNLNLDYTIKELREMVEVVNPANTRALFITVSSKDPREAAQMANEYTEVAKQYIYDTMLSDMPSTLSVALEPTEPVSPRRLLILCASALVCVLISIIILMFVYFLDDKVKTPQDIYKYTGYMPLTVIPLTEMKTTVKRTAYTETEGRRR